MENVWVQAAVWVLIAMLVAMWLKSSTALDEIVVCGAARIHRFVFPTDGTSDQFCLRAHTLGDSCRR
jgi:hypothetical protein